jgi:hypothetical protein
VYCPEPAFWLYSNTCTTSEDEITLPVGEIEDPDFAFKGLLVLFGFISEVC